MSRFAGIPFQVQPEGSGWFPGIFLDDDGKAIYRCRAYIASPGDRTQLARRVSIVTWRRPLGTIGVIGHIEAGRGDDQLVIPDRGGVTQNNRAVLVRMSDVQGYGRRKGQGFMADLEFVIISDPWR